MKTVSRRSLVAGMAISPFAGVLTTSSAFGQEASPQAHGEILLHIDAHDFAYDIPESIKAGLVTVTMTNEGEEPHHAQIIKLKDGVTTEDGMDTILESAAEGAMEIGTFTGGTGTTAPGLSCSVMVDLAPGNYLLVCFLRTADGPTHFEEGMMAGFVIEEGDTTTVEPPDPTATIAMSEYLFEMPGDIEAGEHIWEITNNGSIPHELMVYQLGEGITVTEALSYLGVSSEVPAATAEALPIDPGLVQGIGGMQALTSETTGYLLLDLEPGTYIASCMLPVPGYELNHSHVEFGMLKPFTVIPLNA